MQSLSGKKIAILATNGFEQVELTIPHLKLKDAGATVEVISPERERIRGWNHTDWGDYVGVDRLVDEASADQYDALVLPGGQINPDVLSLNRKALDLIKAFWQQKKVVAAICHAPWLLVETGIINDRKVTSYPSIKTDVINAGGKWEDSPVVADNGLVTSRKPDDLDAFCEKIAEEINEGRHQQRAA